MSYTAKRFATMTAKIAVMLIYAVGEWILISLLLFNSLFSYLIVKFADQFALKPPCSLCCTTPHRIFKPTNIQTDLFCEIHAKEISKLWFCSNHQKLSEFGQLCEACLSEFDKKRPDFGPIGVNSELEGGDGVVTVECLKSALRAEQKALQALEEEQIKKLLDYDGLSIDLNQDAKEFGSNPGDDFEKERSSILVQLEALEEKLVSLEREEEEEERRRFAAGESNEPLVQEILQHLHNLRDVELLESVRLKH